jgi:hypothetical protein
MIMNRSAKKMMAVGVVATTALAAGGTAVASARSSGTAGKAIYVIATRTFGQTTGPVQFAGAIGDYGQGEYSNASGTPSSSGNYYLTRLQHGHVIVNLTKLNRRLRSANPSEYNPQTCSGVIRISASAAITGGTGAYKGAHGTLAVSTVSEFVVPRFTKGAKADTCNINSLPTHAFTMFTAKGRASM